MRPALVIATGLACVFAFPGRVDAHIGVMPGLLVVGETQTLSLSVHNDLNRPMTGLAVSAPTGTRIGLAGVGDEWQAVIENGTATWTGGPLAANAGTTFELAIAVDAATRPGPVELRAQQLYPGGGSLPSPIPMTVIPGTVGEASLDPLYIPGIVFIGLLVMASIVILAWLKRRRRGTLQER